MIDIHSHIIPGIDDGADSIDTAMEMLEKAQNYGTSKIIATPHYYRGVYENEYDNILMYVNELNQRLSEKHLDIEVLPGQEIYIDKYTLDLYKEGKIKGLNNTRYMLVETHMESLPKDALDIIYELRVENIKPILAHPERYKFIIDKPSRINEFLDEGCLLQINSGSITGLFGKEVQKTAQILIKNSLCHFIASDAHSNGRRVTGIGKAINLAAQIDVEIEEKLKNNIEKMINNLNIDSNFHRIKEKKKLFDFFGK